MIMVQVYIINLGLKEVFQEIRFTMMYGIHEDIERFLSMSYKSLQIQTIDPKTGEVIEYLFDSQRCIAQGRGRRQGNKEIIEWVWSATAHGATSVSIIEKINDDKFTYNHKYILPNGNKMDDNVEFTRRKLKAEK